MIWMILLLLVVGCTSEPDVKHGVEVHFFYSNKCSDCLSEDPFMKELNNMDGVTVYYHDVEDSLEDWKKMASEHNVETGSLPMTFVGDKVFGGYKDYDGDLKIIPMSNLYVGYRNQILSAVEEELAK